MPQRGVDVIDGVTVPGSQSIAKFWRMHRDAVTLEDADSVRESEGLAPLSGLDKVGDAERELAMIRRREECA